jgi:hypothetical protein
MDFEQGVISVIRRLKLGEISAAEASPLLCEFTRIELDLQADAPLMAELRAFTESACSRHFGGDPDDDSMLNFILRRVKRLRSGRLTAPVQDGDVVWI